MSATGGAYELAQVNIGRLRGPIESRRLRPFVDALDPVNAEADTAAGFRWRLQSDEGNATSIQAFGWDVGDSCGVIINMSVWQDLESLKAFLYSGAHVEIMKRRRQFFEKMQEAYLALWWVPAGHRPSTDEAEERVRRLRAHGPTLQAFTFRTTFPPPGPSEPPTPVDP